MKEETKKRIVQDLYEHLGRLIKDANEEFSLYDLQTIITLFFIIYTERNGILLENKDLLASICLKIIRNLESGEVK